jgi:hypothetical protein
MRLSSRLVTAIFLVIVATAATEAWMGRLPLGPDGHFGWIETDIWSSEQSQRVLDPYSLSHIIHGFLFYGPAVARGAPRADWRSGLVGRRRPRRRLGSARETRRSSSTAIGR